VAANNPNGITGWIIYPAPSGTMLRRLPVYYATSGIIEDFKAEASYMNCQFYLILVKEKTGRVPADSAKNIPAYGETTSNEGHGWAGMSSPGDMPCQYGPAIWTLYATGYHSYIRPGVKALDHPINGLAVNWIRVIIQDHYICSSSLQEAGVITPDTSIALEKYGAQPIPALLQIFSSPVC
jgi:hypothetical protein